MVERREKMSWRLDKNIPLSLLLAIGLQSFGIAWWAATQSAQTKANTDTITTMQRSEKESVEATTEIKERLVRVETNVSMQSASLDRIEDLVRDHMESIKKQ